MLDLARIKEVAEAAALAAGGVVLDGWGAYRFDVQTKGTTDIISAADIASDKIIASIISNAFPGHRVLSEEDTQTGTYNYDGPLWVIDPIDGTANYVRGHPYFGISVAFALDGVVQAGCVHAPALAETFIGIKGGGATLNGLPIKASAATSLNRSVVSTGFPHEKWNFEALNRRVDRLLRHSQDIRRSASPVLDICYVAMGRLDAHTETLFAWDVAAAGLIATEAGAVRSLLLTVPENVPADLFGGEVVFSAPEIHQELVCLLREAQSCYSP